MILIEPFIRPHKQSCDRTHSKQISTAYISNNMLGAIRVLFFMSEDGAGQFHHGKRQRIGSMVVSLRVTFFTWLDDFLVGDAPECRVQ